MRPDDLFLRCYARKEDGIWVAVCIDLALASQGDTLAEAKAELEGMITDYVCEAFTDLSQAKAMLKRRKSPLVDRLMYRYIWACNRINGLAQRFAQTFDLITPVRPCGPNGGVCGPQSA